MNRRARPIAERLLQGQKSPLQERKRARRDPGRTENPMDKGIQIRQSFVVKLSRDKAYAFWRRFEDFPKFMKHVESVEPLDAKRSRWIVEGPAGRSVTWESEIVEEDPGRTLAWRTIGGSEIRHGGRVELYDATAGTSVDLEKSPYVLAAARGIRDGLKVGLGL